MPVFKIHHITKYNYNTPVIDSVNQLRLFPFTGNEQEILQQDFQISYQPDIYFFNDYWGNKTGIFTLNEPHSELIIESRLIVRTTGLSDNNIFPNSIWEDLQNDKSENLELLELSNGEFIQSLDKINEIIAQIFLPSKSISEIVEACSRYIFQNFKYIKGITDIETTVDQILHYQSGVCQDFAHVMLQILRTLNIPCRYVSGYICPSSSGMRGEGATHAWVEAWIPKSGWIGIDPTNNIWVSNKHVKLAVGRNFLDCSPVKGVFKGTANQNLSVFVSIGYEDGHIFEDVNNVNMAVEEINNHKNVNDLAMMYSQQ